ncbi:PD40 domain-containing protein [Candidatus Sumerlaeota bacterium]|nr:PD40 domain-containing protein [Candidatus Sumerlaeota bacterium]
MTRPAGLGPPRGSTLLPQGNTSSGRIATLVCAALLACTWAMDLGAEELMDGAQLIALTDDGKSRAMSWAWHAERIAYLREISDTQNQLRIINADGSGDQQVSQIGNPFFVEWSWGSDRLSYLFSEKRESESQGGIFIFDIEAKRTMSISPAYTMSTVAGFGGGGGGRRGRGGGGRGRGGGRRGGRGFGGFGGGPPLDGPYWSSDDQYVAYKIRPGSDSEVWTVETESGKRTRVLAQRGSASGQRWSPVLPARLSLQTEASGGRSDIAVVNPRGTDLVMLTNIGSEDLRIRSPVWSPTGEWLAYTSDADMTLQERDRGRSDVWIIHPDGTGARNLTQASTERTEDQLSVFAVIWSWDGEKIISIGQRYDEQGRGIFALYEIDPRNGGYEILMTSDPQGTAEIDRYTGFGWSYDSTKLLVLIQRNRVRNWGSDTSFEDPRTLLTIVDMETKDSHVVLAYNEERDRKEITGRPSWAPDSRSIVLTLQDILSRSENILEADIFRLELPEELISPEAPLHYGPPIGRQPIVLAQASPPGSGADDSLITGSSGAAPAAMPRAQEISNGEIMKIVAPQYLMIADVKDLLSDFGQYLSDDEGRNFFLFKGPEAIYEQFVDALAIIDTPVPHLLVDLLAIEMSNEANRSLGLDWTFAQGRFGFFQPQGLGLRDLTPGLSVLPPLDLIPSIGAETLQALEDELGVIGIDSLSNATLRGLGTFRDSGGGQAFYQGVGRLPSEFFVRLIALENDGRVTILANPRNVSMTGRESVIQLRRTVDFFFTEGLNVLTGTPEIRKADATQETVGRITPTLLASGKINMQVDVTIGTLTFSPEGLPERTQRQVVTEVTVEEGETIIIGGLRQQSLVINETRTPILGSLPFIGAFFRHDAREIQHSVLTILITPRVLDMENNPVPDWPVLDAADFPVTPIMKDSTIEDEAEHALTPEWTAKRWEAIKGFFGGGSGADKNEEN